MKLTGQWRITPPTHVLLALKSALNQLKIEGGVKSRNKRYMQNCNFIRQEMQKIGFNCIVKDSLQAPIIVTFETPRSITSRFSEFYNRLSNEGYIIYPGKITKMNTFRIGCIGNINLRDFKKLSKNYRKYSWHKNAGYGTNEHLKAIKKFGLTKYHRKTFRPAYNMLSR